MRQRRGKTEDRQRRGEAAEAEDRLSGAGGGFLGQGLLVCVAVASLGLFLSALISHQIIESPPNRGKVEKAYVDLKCDQLASETWPAAKGFTLSTKSPYQFAEPVFNQEQVEGCSAVQLHVVLRHGTRSPSVKDFSKWQKLLDSFRSTLAWNASLEWDQGQTYAGSVPYELTQRGYWEQFCLARRFRERFPSLLKRPYSKERFVLRSTQVSRSFTSALSFANGLFHGTGPLDGYQPVFIQSRPTGEDVLLRFFDHCPRYLTQVKNNKSLSDYIHECHSSDEAKRIVDKVQRILDPDHLVASISPKEVEMLRKMCLFELALFNNSDRWCRVFTEEDQVLLEYCSDFKDYWLKGHGSQLAWLSSGPLLLHVLEAMQQHTSQEVPGKLMQGGASTLETTAFFYFAHAETILPLVTFLGLFNDSQPLRHDNHRDMKDRQFVTGKIVPFSANLALVLYQCPDNELKVGALVNERPVRIPFCSGEGVWEPDSRAGLCPLQALLLHAATHMQHQSFEDICRV